MNAGFRHGVGAALSLLVCVSAAQAQDRFLGTGGGQWLLTTPDAASPGGRRSFQPLRCGGALCELDLKIADIADSDDPQRVLYRSRFKVRATSNLPGCQGAQGVVDGAQIDLGACGRGAFVGPNEVHLRLPGRGEVAAWVFDFVPDLHSGAWAVVGQPGRVFKFQPPRRDGGVLAARGCELKAGAPQVPAEIVVSLSNFREAASAGGAAVPALKPRTKVARLAASGGPAFSGEFVGVSALQLRSPQGVLRLERRKLNVSC